jgi:hypothetical protein
MRSPGIFGDACHRIPIGKHHYTRLITVGSIPMANTMSFKLFKVRCPIQIPINFKGDEMNYVKFRVYQDLVTEIQPCIGYLREGKYAIN